MVHATLCLSFAFVFLFSSASGAQEPRKPYDPILSYKLALLSFAAYCPPQNVAAWNCTLCKQFGPMRSVWTAYSAFEDSFAYAATDGGNIYVVFRGTISPRNWWNNFKQELVPLYVDDDSPQVHYGFLATYTSLYTRLDWNVVSGKIAASCKQCPIYYTGHSLGGAMATIAAAISPEKLPNNTARLYTFGSPRVGNKEFAEVFDKTISTSYRIVWKDDIVPQIPLPKNYHHVAEEVWYVNGTTNRYRICDDSGEDKTCSWTVSIGGSNWQSHLLYMGIDQLNNKCLV